MITTNAAWDAKNAELAKKPIFAFTISGQATVYTTHDLVAEGITGVLPTHQPWLDKRSIGGLAQQVDVVNGTSSIGDLQLNVVDVGGAIRTLAGSTVLEGATATLSVGYPGIAWSEFVTLHTYLLYKVTPVEGYGAWTFAARDRQILLRKTIYYHPENGGRLSESNPWYLCGTPIEIFQAIALFALGLDVAAIDRTQMQALDSTSEGIYAGARPFEFVLTEPFEAQQFLEGEVFKPSGLYPVVNELGQISLRSMHPPAAGASPVFAFTDSNTIGLPVVDRKPVINEAVWEYDEGDGGDFGTKSYYLEATSLSTFLRAQQFAVQSKGLRSELGASWFTQWVSHRMFQRFAGSPSGLKGGAPVVDIQAFFLTLPVWVGDYVTLTHPKMPDVTSGALGVAARVFEVVDRQPDYARGRMRYRLLDTGLTGAASSKQWGAAAARPLVIGTGKWY